jgi:hypothetical protein
LSLVVHRGAVDVVNTGINPVGTVANLSVT